jgi:hypothetical protein
MKKEKVVAKPTTQKKLVKKVAKKTATKKEKVKKVSKEKDSKLELPDGMLGILSFTLYEGVGTKTKLSVQIGGNRESIHYALVNVMEENEEIRELIMSACSNVALSNIIEKLGDDFKKPTKKATKKAKK